MLLTAFDTKKWKAHALCFELKSRFSVIDCDVVMVLYFNVPCPYFHGDDICVKQICNAIRLFVIFPRMPLTETHYANDVTIVLVSIDGPVLGVLGIRGEEHQGILEAHLEGHQQAYLGSLEEHRGHLVEGMEGHPEEEREARLAGAWEGRWDQEGKEAWEVRRDRQGELQRLVRITLFTGRP